MKKLPLLLVLISVFCFSQNKFKTYSKDNYTINYPESWDLDISGQMNTSLLLFSKPSSNNDDFRENVNIIIQKLGYKNIDIQEYAEISINQIKSSGKILKNKLINNKYVIEWKAFINQRNLKFKQYYFVKNRKAYVVTFTAKENEYDNYIREANQILDSFKLTK